MKRMGKGTLGDKASLGDHDSEIGERKGSFPKAYGKPRV